jgi:hypothetical protein
MRAVHVAEQIGLDDASIGVSVKRPTAPTPALLIQTRIGPSYRVAPAARARTAPLSVTSVGIATARPLGPRGERFALACRAVQRLLAARRQRDACPLPREAARRRATDAV